MKTILQDITNHTLKVCSAPIGHPDRLEIFQHSSCLNYYSQEIQKCYQTLPNVISYMLENLPKNRIPIACCNVALVRQCSKRKVRKFCGKLTTEFVSRTDPFNNIINIICSSNCFLFNFN